MRKQVASTLLAAMVLLLGTACDSSDDNVEPVDQTQQDAVTDLSGDAVEDSQQDLPGDLPVDHTDDVDQDDSVTENCPSQASVVSAECSTEGLKCTYGTECCCGECFDSLVCTCMGGTFGCYHTDACLMPSCEGACCTLGKEGECHYYGETPHLCAAVDGSEKGRCMPVQQHPSCWDDAQCEDGEECVGAWACACDADCDGEDVPGTCTPKQPVPDGCCLDDSDCDKGIDMAFVCVQGPAELLGVCLPLAGQGSCWSHSDCSQGQYCEGPTVCPCGADCLIPNAPGQCVEPAKSGPCYEDSQCSDGEFCVGAKACGPGEDDPFWCEPAPGKCQAAPDQGLCWSDTHCQWPAVCVNPVYCQGGQPCLIDEHPGVCLAQATTGCWSDMDCLSGDSEKSYRCTDAWVAPLWNGPVDAEPDHEGECCLLAPGECLTKAHCAAGAVCEGAQYSGAGACALGTALPGKCVISSPLPDELCLDDASCDGGESCVGEWLCPQGVACIEQPYPGLCLPHSTAPGGCYDDTSCDPGETCQGAMVCDVMGGQLCGAMMASPGQCVDLPPGDLGEPCGMYGGDCAQGLVCCYPCGVPGCINRCEAPCDPSEPWCTDGCAAMP